MWLQRAARAWLVVANGVALAYVTCIIILHSKFLTVTSLQIGLSQLGANTVYFFSPVVVGSTIILITHVLLIAHWLLPIHRFVMSAVSRARQSRGPRINPTVVSVVPASLTESFRVASGRLETNKSLALGKWARHSSEITRIFTLWEVASQTFQAYKLSYLVTSVSINRLMALVIVTNCWFSPLLHYAMGNRPKVHIRLGRLVIDSSLDVVYNVLIPVSILYPYYRDYDGSVSLYPVVFYYDDTWYVNAVSELRQVFVTSWPDFISKGSGGLSLTYRFSKLKAAIDTVRKDVSRSQSDRVVSVAEATSWYRSRCSRFLDLVLVLWGATVLGLHVTSSITSLQFHDSGCLSEMRPWGSLSYSCASFEISCSKRPTSGDRETLEQILGKVDPIAVQNLILSNCEQLQVPHAIQNLPYLSMIKIYNSTIVSWDTKAALRESYHPQLQVIYLARVNMSELPEGLLAPDFPPTVWDIEFCITNLSAFPSATTKAWANVGIVAHEGNPALTEFPESLAALENVFTLNMGMNNITTVRDGLFSTHELLGIGMNGNPVEKLPDNIGSIHRLEFLNFVETQISDIPSAWMDFSVPAAMPTLFAAGSPLCRSINAKQDVTKPSWLNINCDLPPSGLFSYPIDEEDAWRRANQ